MAGTRDRGTPAGERTRERVLDVALPLFAEHGFAGTSVRRVAKAAGVNVATLAYHFQDKAGLYDAVVLQMYEELAAMAPAAVDLGRPDVLRGIVEQMWGFAKARRVHVRLLHRHLLDRGRHHEVAADRWVGRLLRTIDPFLLAVRPDWPTPDRRLLVLSASHLIVRFALEDTDQLAAFLEVDDGLDDAVVDWITAMIGRQLRER